jgi:hypothetical protein
LWRPAFVVELAVSAAVLPLQFASLAVVTLPLTLPLILGLQAALPVAVLEGGPPGVVGGGGSADLVGALSRASNAG